MKTYNIYANNEQCKQALFHVYEVGDEQTETDDLFLIAGNVVDEYEAIASFCKTLDPRKMHDARLLDCAKKTWNYKA